MSAEEQLHSDLIGYAGLQALVGNGDSPATYRVYPMIRPQEDTLPVVVYELVSSDRQNTLTDAVGQGKERNVLDIYCWATTLSGAQAVNAQVELALAASSYNYVDLSEANVFDYETRLFGIRHSFAQWYS